jgi:DNA-binding HxlR family transcriptional regulator
MAMTPSSSAACPIYRIIEKLSKKWSLLILRSFTEQNELHFSEILHALPEINARILTERLREFEEEKLIRRTVKPTTPITITYKITAKGMDLQRVFDSFVVWTKKWGKRK